jgi:hypothetical protein
MATTTTSTHRPHPQRPPAAEGEGPHQASSQAPAMNVRGVPITVRLDVRVGGAEGQVSFTCLPEQLGEMRKALAAQGVRPRVSYDRTADGAPICPRHGVVMHRREKQGDEWFSHKVVDRSGKEHFCRGYRGKDSPGYDVRMEGEG